MAFNYDSDGNGTLDAVAQNGVDINGDGRADALNGNNLTDLNEVYINDADDDLTGAGVVYLVYGGTHLTGTINLNQIGTASLPGLVFVGRKAGDHLGGGRTQTDLLSRGVNTAGDMDGDGRDDLLLSAILADPEGKTNAGEVYVVYGFAP